MTYSLKKNFVLGRNNLKTYKEIFLRNTSSKNIKLPFFYAAERNKKDIAIIDEHGIYTYKDIISYSQQLYMEILNLLGKGHSSLLNQNRIGFVSSNNVFYTVCQWATWMAGGVAVPLCKSHPESELQYTIENSQCSLVITDDKHSEKIWNVKQKTKFNLSILNHEEYWKSLADKVSHINFQDLVNIWDKVDSKHRNAMLVYTSGTTARPKGVVWTFENVDAQLKIMSKKWKVSSDDTFLHVLPLHHVHGIMNVLLLPLVNGAKVKMLPNFNAKQVWDCLLNDPDVNVFHAVPTIYYKLIEYYEKNFQNSESIIKEKLKQKMRLMVSGSAALPEPILRKWYEISGHVLLERYGMTEIGMALTNDIHGRRVAGSVGKPFPTVKARIVSTTNNETLVEGDTINVIVKDHTEKEGNLHIQGPSVFKEYWNNPEATKETFTSDGWFITGDTACYDDKENVFRILGRTSVDIIKSGGYKISALDVERHLLTHPYIKEVAVLGLPCEEWGQVIFALIVSSDVNLSLNELKIWGKKIMPDYQIPKKIKLVESIPRNVMGKVNKKELARKIEMNVI